jgi:hypothetical protein
MGTPIAPILAAPTHADAHRLAGLDTEAEESASEVVGACRELRERGALSREDHCIVVPRQGSLLDAVAHCCGLDQPGPRVGELDTSHHCLLAHQRSLRINALCASTSR